MGVRVEMPSNNPIVLLRERDGGPLPADLGRRGRGHRDRLRPAGHRAAAAADPRPAARRPRRPSGVSLQRGADHRAEDGVFYAVLVFNNGVEVSARPSDAIALALRIDAPIRGADEVLEAAGIDIPDDEQGRGRGREVPRVPRPGVSRRTSADASRRPAATSLTGARNLSRRLRVWPRDTPRPWFDRLRAPSLTSASQDSTSVGHRQRSRGCAGRGRGGASDAGGRRRT